MTRSGRIKVSRTTVSACTGGYARVVTNSVLCVPWMGAIAAQRRVAFWRSERLEGSVLKRKNAESPIQVACLRRMSPPAVCPAWEREHLNEGRS